MKQAVRDKLNALLAFLHDQMKDASTLRGVAMLCGTFALFKGYDPAVVMMFVTFIVGILGVLLPDRLK